MSKQNYQKNEDNCIHWALFFIACRTLSSTHASINELHCLLFKLVVSVLNCNPVNLSLLLLLDDPMHVLRYGFIFCNCIWVNYIAFYLNYLYCSLNCNTVKLLLVITWCHVVRYGLSYATIKYECEVYGMLCTLLRWLCIFYYIVVNIYYFHVAYTNV